MKTIYELQQIADRLRASTEVNSISPEDTFGLQADVLEYLADMEQNAEGLGIHQVYASYAAMLADASAPVGSNGKPLRFGQLVVIYDSSNTTQAESGNVYAWQKGNTGASAWKLMGNLGNVHALQSQIDSLLSSDESMKGKLTELGKQVIAQYISFEAGAVNYLNGKLVSSGKSIRTDAIPISEDVRIIGYFNRTLNKVYIVKYLNGIYAGYEQISFSGMNIDQLLLKDTSFDSFRLRVDVPNSVPDWSDQDILDSSASIYVQNSIAGKVETLSSSVQEIENKITSTPSSMDDLLNVHGTMQLLQRMSLSYFTETKEAYVNLNNLSVGSTFIFQTVIASAYTYECVSVKEGDVILLTTKGNTVGAKAYAIIDAEDKVLAIHQEPISNAVLVMPTGAKKFIANTSTTTNDYALTYIMGKTADYDSAVEQLHTFDRGKYSFISSGAYVKLSNGPIPSGSTIIAVTGSDAVTNINLYDADGKNRRILPIDSLPYTTTIDYYKASTYISGHPLLTIVTGGIKDVLEGLQKGVSPDTGAIISKKYRIGNHDNDFSFDNLFVGQLVASFLQLQRNFEIPCDGVCISTDVENVVKLSEPVTDEQMLKANVPYLYIDGVKRGTIVLFDTDGTPFIYDNTGKKRYLTLS